MPVLLKKALTLSIKNLYKQVKNCPPCLTILASIFEGGGTAIFRRDGRS